jgi:hypothetical protein
MKLIDQFHPPEGIDRGTEALEALPPRDGVLNRYFCDCSRLAVASRPASYQPLGV